MQEIKISVIIPVFNAERFLRKCLDSVTNQSFKDIEIICVNDGSSDLSLDIINDYMNKDSRIKLINQKNSGVSVARNKGIEVARGDYVVFLDSDDWLEPNALEQAYSKVVDSNSDVIIFGANIVEKGKIIGHTNLNLIDKINLKQDIFMDFININLVVWDKIFRTEFLRKNKILFPEGYVVSEDGIFCLLVYFAGAKYDYLSKCLYNYNDIVENSVTANCKYAIKEDLRAFKYLYNLDIFQAQPKDIQMAIVNKFCGGAEYYWYRLNDENYRDEFYASMLELKHFLNESYTVNELKTQKGYLKLLTRIKQYKGIFPYNIICITKLKYYKYLRILGIEKKIPLKKVIQYLDPFNFNKA